MIMRWMMMDDDGGDDDWVRSHGHTHDVVV
jgi:hypothetical protein